MMNVDNAIVSTTVTATTSDANASLTINAVAQASGVASSEIALAEGDSTITVVVTAEDAVTQKTYTVTIIRASAPSPDADLSSLTLSAGSFTPTFDGATTDYLINVDHSVDSTMVTATASDTNASLTINAVAVASGVASSAIALVVGSNIATVVVTAEDSVTQKTYTVTITRALPDIMPFEVLDPTPRANDEFGRRVVILGNGNIVVNDVNDSSIASVNGAVHLYDPIAQTLIASIYGDQPDDGLGVGITALGNNNFVIASGNDDNGAIVDAGSVMLIDGSTGTVIGTPLVGDQTNDRLGSSGILALGNNNYVIISTTDDDGAIVDAGSVRLVNGSTGVPIGTAVVGDQADDQLGSVTALDNNNYVIRSSVDDDGATVDAGSVRLVNGSNGLVIGTPMVGDQAGDSLGSSRITALSNNNYVIASRFDDDGTTVDAGSVRLVNGSTGVTIGTPLVGDQANDKLGDLFVTALSNNNYVIASGSDDDGASMDVGSVRLVDGSTGLPIGNPVIGDQMSDLLSSRVTALGNSNYVIAAPLDDDGVMVDVGSVHLVDGSTGATIDTPLTGDQANDLFGNQHITALANNNYVIASSSDDDGATLNAGSVKLVNGSTGIVIGTPLVGAQSSDFMGDRGTTALGNNNYVIRSSMDDDGATVDAGSVRLVNGSSGVPIGTPLFGDQANDRLGFNGITVLGNNNYVIVSRLDDNGAITDAGSVHLVDGNTGIAIDTVLGLATDDIQNVTITKPILGDYFVLAAPKWDNNSQVDSGLVRIIAP